MAIMWLRWILFNCPVLVNTRWWIEKKY